MLDPSILVGTTPLNAAVSADADPLNQLRQAVQQQTQRATDAETHAKILAAIIEIQIELDCCGDFEAAALTAARLLSQTLGNPRVQIAWRTGDAKTSKLIADTLQSDTDLSAKFSAAAEEICARGAATRYPSSDHRNRHALLAVAQYAEVINARSIVAVPLVDGGGDRGAILVISDPRRESDQPIASGQSIDSDMVAVQIDAISGALANKLACLEAMQPRVWERLVRTVTDRAHHSRRNIIIAAIGSVCLALMIPVHYHVKADCELQPIERRFVAAPFDGALQTVLVRPGDIVEAGETLARINPREIEYELSGIRAKLKRATQEQKGLMAEHDFGGSKIATLEAERLRSEQELLQYKRDNLDVRSPLAGIVVSGDLKQSEGTPLSKGETMFEIALLGEMIVEIAIPESDVAFARVGMPVEFYLHALPTEKLSGELQHVHPQAEIRDHENVFVGEVLVQDPQGVLRPGMRGRSWVKSDRHTLAWNLFHKAYYSIRTSMGW